MVPQFLAAYVILSLIVGLLGRNKQIGFWGFFLLSLVVTPVVVGFFMLVTRTRRPREVRVRN
jgi:ABC-type molybdate transport system permease subunit